MARTETALADLATRTHAPNGARGRWLAFSGCVIAGLSNEVSGGALSLSLRAAGAAEDGRVHTEIVRCSRFGHRLLARPTHGYSRQGLIGAVAGGPRQAPRRQGVNPLHEERAGPATRTC
jgi:hypothetical protein